MSEPRRAGHSKLVARAGKIETVHDSEAKLYTAADLERAKAEARILVVSEAATAAVNSLSEIEGMSGAQKRVRDAIRSLDPAPEALEKYVDDCIRNVEEQYRAQWRARGISIPAEGKSLVEDVAQKFVAARVETALEQREADAAMWDNPEYTEMVGTNIAREIRNSPLAPGTQHLLEAKLAEARLEEANKWFNPQDDCTCANGVRCWQHGRLAQLEAAAKERK